MQQFLKISLKHNRFTNPTMHQFDIPQCTIRKEMYTFLFWMVHCGIWDRCIVGFVNKFHWNNQIHKSHNAPIRYPKMHHTEKKCINLCSVWYIVGYGTAALWDLWINFTEIKQINKSHNAPIRYPIMHHSEQKCAHFCSEWCIVGHGAGAMWDFWIWSIAMALKTY